MSDLGDFLASINRTKKNLMRDNPEMIQKYQGFVVNRLLSYHQDAILYTNELNQLKFLDGQLQYEFLLEILPKKNRFQPLHKQEKIENLQWLKRYYGYNDQRAMEVLELHSASDIEAIKKHYDEGGLVK